MRLLSTIRDVAGRGASRYAALNLPQVSPPRGRAALILSEVAVGIVAFAAWTVPLQAGTIDIPNASFESPVAPQNPGALPQIDSWQQTPTWDFYESGVFLNQAGPYYVYNGDGTQAAFLFVETNQTAIFQDYDSTDWSNSVPTHAFNATFDVGKSYTLTVAVLGGTNVVYPMLEGTSLELSLYYRDSSSNLVTVAATSITNSWALFSDSSNAPLFIDFQVQVPTVKASDPWAGQHIGVQLSSPAVSTNLLGGYWDLDNVRLVSSVPTTLLAPAWTNGQFAFTLQSEPGLSFEILASTNLALPLSNWTSLEPLTNVTGTVPFLDRATNLNRRFYRARQLP
jgi:hypothetical protein